MLKRRCFAVDAVQEQPKKQSVVVVHETEECGVPKLRQVRLPDVCVGFQLTLGGPSMTAVVRFEEQRGIASCDSYLLKSIVKGLYWIVCADDHL